MNKPILATDAEQFDKIMGLFCSLRRRGWTHEAISRECERNLILVYMPDLPLSQPLAGGCPIKEAS